MSYYNKDWPTIFVLNGKTCSGKSTVEAALVERHKFSKIVSHTTRAMRPGEVNGEQYHFIGKSRFVELINNNEMIEHAEFNGNYYGSAKSELSKAHELGVPAVIVTETHGRDLIVEYCEKNNINCVNVYIQADPSVLASRILNRALDEYKLTGDVVNSSKRLEAIMTTEVSWTPDEFPYSLHLTSNSIDDITNAVEAINDSWHCINEGTFNKPALKI